MDVQNLLLGGGVESVDSLSDTGSNSLGVVVVESSRDTLLVVDLFCLADDGLGGLVDLARDGLVLANDLASDSVVNAGKEV
jgi:hypothetical protein